MPYARTLLLGLSLLALGYASTGSSSADEADASALSSSVDRIQRAVSGAVEGAGVLGDTLAELDALTGRLEPKLRDRLLERVQAVRRGMGGVREQLGEISDELELAGDVETAFGLARQARTALDPSRRDALASLRLLKDVLATAGEVVPKPVAGILAAYEASLEAVTGALERVTETLRVRVDQGMIGSGAHGGSNDVRYRALVRDFGQRYADSHTFAPSPPGPLFRIVGDARRHCLLWDAKAGRWTRFDGEVPVERIVTDVLLTGREVSASELAALARDADAWSKRRAAAGDVLTRLGNWRMASVSASEHAALRQRVFDRLDEEEGGRITRELASRARFRARYALDGTFRAWADAALQTLRSLFEKERQKTVTDFELLVFEGSAKWTITVRCASVPDDTLTLRVPTRVEIHKGRGVHLDIGACEWVHGSVTDVGGEFAEQPVWKVEFHRYQLAEPMRLLYAATGDGTFESRERHAAVRRGLRGAFDLERCRGKGAYVQVWADNPGVFPAHECAYVVEFDLPRAALPGD